MQNQITKSTKPDTITIRKWIESEDFRSEVARVISKRVSPDKMIRIVTMAIAKNSKLADCEQTSFVASVLTLAAVGLEPDGRLAHLVPFYSTKKQCYECTQIIDWKGLAQIAYRSGMVSRIHADVLRTGDLFEYDCGAIKLHVPHFLRRDTEKPKSPGDIIGAYAIAIMKDGARPGVVVSEAGIQEIRRRSKSADAGPWVTDTDEMRKKTAFRRLSKWLPVDSEEFKAALDADDIGGDAIKFEAPSQPEIRRVNPEPIVVEPVVVEPNLEPLRAEFKTKFHGIAWKQIRPLAVEGGWWDNAQHKTFAQLDETEIKFLIERHERIMKRLTPEVSPSPTVEIPYENPAA